jgi:hypothetical protein
VLDLGTDYLVLEKNHTPGALWRLLEPHTTPLYQDAELVLLTAEQVRSLSTQAHEQARFGLGVRSEIER